MEKRYVSCFRRWNVVAIIGFVLSFFSISTLAGFISAILCAIGMFMCRKTARRGFRLAMAGLIISILMSYNMLFIMVRNDISFNLSLELGILSVSLFFCAIIVGCMALFDHKHRKESHIMEKEKSAKSTSVMPQLEATQPELLIPIQPSNENQIVFRYAQMKPMDVLLGEKPPIDIPYDLCISRWLVQRMKESGYVMQYISIGGGCDEVSHTGAVAYGGTYRNADSFIDRCYEDYREADAEATAEYGSWFSNLNYHFIHIAWEKNDGYLEAKLTSHVEIQWRGNEEAERIAHRLKETMMKSESSII